MNSEHEAPRRAIPRGRIALAAIAVLLVLDIGRSINARTGYSRPIEVWEPNPTVYADLTWPPGANLPAATTLGGRVYARRCAICHGPDGRGNGPAAPSMIPRPRDFTLGLFKYKSTPPGQPPTEDDLREVVTNGLSASAMPYFRDLLSPAEIDAVVVYVQQFSGTFREARPESIAIPKRPEPTASSIDRGRVLYTAWGCAGCHGPDGRKGGYLQDAKSYPTTVRDLSAPWTFRGGNDPGKLWLRLTTGLAGSSMPSYAYALTPDERWDVVAYLQSLMRRPPWEPSGQLGGPGKQSDLLRRGEYLVHAEMCGLCHTQIDRTGIYRGDDRYLAGGMRVVAYPHGVFVSRNLTSDRETGLGSWTEGQIINAFRNGRAPTRLLTLWAMPWFYLHYLANEDATAVARYLRTLPPVHNHIPAPLHYGVIETIVSKLSRSLPAANVTVLSYADGNFGQAQTSGFRVAESQGRGITSAETWQTALVDLQWLVLALAALAFLFVGSQRPPRTLGGWFKLSLGGLALLLIGTIGWVLYALPTLAFFPPEQIANAATAGIPELASSASTTPEQRALIERGRYLYTVASCAFCHNPNGAGGQKISWRPFGTLWTRNITSDRQTGIGSWTDPEITRAIRSGMTPDGRTLHWQGMIWDHASNWDEEDVRAIVAYLRELPPVVRQVPASHPPAADDCEVYTFWVARSDEPGCR